MCRDCRDGKVKEDHLHDSNSFSAVRSLYRDRYTDRYTDRCENCTDRRDREIGVLELKTPLYSLYGLYIFYNGLYNGLYSGLYIETVPRGMLIGFDAGNAHTPTVAYVSLGACCKALLAPHRFATMMVQTFC